MGGIRGKNREEYSIINYLFARYLEDLNRRDKIIFPVLKKYNEDNNANWCLGGGTRFTIKPLTYVVDGKEYLLETEITFVDDEYSKIPLGKIMKSYNFRRSKNSVRVNIYKKTEIGKLVCIGFCDKARYYNNVDIYYRVFESSYRIVRKINNTCYYINIKEVSKNGFDREFDREFKDAIDPKFIASIYDKVNSKIGFEYADNVERAIQGVYEIGDWPEKTEDMNMYGRGLRKLKIK